VVELARLAWGYDERKAHVAAANLLMEFGFDPPQRPPAYFRKQERQRSVREKLDEVRVNSARRRLLRTLMPAIACIEDPEERHEEMQRIWRELEVVARLLVREGR